MKKSTAIVLILISLMALGTICFQPTKAAQSILVINSDGSIYPQTQTMLIQQADNVYTLTSDVDTSVVFNVLKSDIILDGNGHIVSNGWISIGKSPWQTVSVANVTVENFNINITQSSVIAILDSSNITITNNTIKGGSDLLGQLAGIEVRNSSSINIIGNSIENAWCGIHLSGSYDNLIVGNTVKATIRISWGNYGAAIMFNSSFNNLIYENAFLNDGHQTEVGTYLVGNMWDNGTVGNFWSDYKLRYPNATEIDGSGIGNTPYFVNANNIDHYPLMRLGNNSMSVPTPTPAFTPTPIITTPITTTPAITPTTHTPTNTTPFSTDIRIPILPIAFLAIFSILLTSVVSLLLYRRHRKTTA